MERFRVRLRSVVVLIALSALVMSLERLRLYRRERAVFHARMEARYREIDAGALDSAGCRRDEIEYHSKLRREYERPWWSFGPVVPESCSHPRRSP